MPKGRGDQAALQAAWRVTSPTSLANSSVVKGKFGVSGSAGQQSSRSTTTSNLGSSPAFAFNLKEANGVYVENEEGQFEFRDAGVVASAKRSKGVLGAEPVQTSWIRSLGFPVWSKDSLEKDARELRGPNKHWSNCKDGNSMHRPAADLTGQARSAILFPSLIVADEIITDYDAGVSPLSPRAMASRDWCSDTDLDSDIEQELDAWIKEGIRRKGEVAHKRTI